jgi:hypothetical protein
MGGCGLAAGAERIAAGTFEQEASSKRRIGFWIIAPSLRAPRFESSACRSHDEGPVSRQVREFEEGHRGDSAECQPSVDSVANLCHGLLRVGQRLRIPKNACTRRHRVLQRPAGGSDGGVIGKVV